MFYRLQLFSKWNYVRHFISTCLTWIHLHKRRKIWDNVIKNGSSKICWIQPLRKLKWDGLFSPYSLNVTFLYPIFRTLGEYELNRPYHFKFFKDCLPPILFAPFLNTLSHISFNISLRLLKKLKEKDEKQLDLERREQGFSIYLNGANVDLQLSGHHRSRKTKTAGGEYYPAGEECSKSIRKRLGQRLKFIQRWH